MNLVSSIENEHVKQILSLFYTLCIFQFGSSRSFSNKLEKYRKLLIDEISENFEVKFGW